MLLDTGAVYAYYDRDDEWHEAMRSTIDTESGPLVLPAAVLPEIDHLLKVRLGHRAQVALYTELVANVYLIANLESNCYQRVLELNRQYADLGLGFVDAAVAALSEQLGVRRLATTDRRHFPAIARSVGLELVPSSPAG